jgi:hypothetical protein
VSIHQLITENKGNIEIDDYAMMKNIYESDRYLFFSFSYSKENYLTIYDKSSKQVLDNCIASEKMLNDMDEFVPIKVSTVNNNELCGILDTQDILEWAQTHPQHLSAPLSFVKDMDEMSNPVIVIAQLKKGL